MLILNIIYYTTAERSDLVHIFGEKGAKIGIISWGSSAESALAAMSELNSEGYAVKVLVPEIIFPFPEKSISEFLKSIKVLVMIEMNHSGQLFNLIKIHSYKHLPPNVIQINQVGGKMLDKKEISEEIKKIAALADDWKAPWYGI